jgi:hypothetical protein
LARSGEGWAELALSPRGAHLYISTAGFTHYFRQKAAEHRRIRLISLEDLY